MLKQDSYSLRQVVDLTGISEFTLRAWEGRYQAFSPRRSETGRRRYSASDLQKAALLRELLKREHRIGAIAHLPLAKLKQLMEEGVPRGPDVSPGLKEEIAAAMGHVALQKWDELESHFQRVLCDRAPLAVIRDFLLPLLQELGAQVSEGRITVSQEHILSSLVKGGLFSLCRRPSPSARSRLVIAAPEGDFHELGILAAHAMATQHGIRSLYLGPNTPKQELCETAIRFEATQVLVGSTVSRKEGAREEIYSVVHFMDQHLPIGVALWLGGRNAGALELSMRRPCARFASLEDYCAFIAHFAQ